MSGQSRRLAAVMLTDCAGYSQLSHRDEGGALDLLEEHRRIVRADAFYDRMRQAETVYKFPLLELTNSALFDEARTDPRYHEMVEGYRAGAKWNPTG